MNVVTEGVRGVDDDGGLLPSSGQVPPGRVSGRQLRELLADDGWLDELVDRADEGGVSLTGPGGFLPEMIKAVLERGLAAELTGHLGYEVGDVAGRGSPNSRNGHTPKTVQTEVGAVPLDVPRDRQGSFEPRLVPKGERRLRGLDDMIISLYSGGMTVRDIQAHLARTVGTELSHDTISKITDAVLEEVKAWQARPLDEVYPIVYVDALVVKVRDGHQVRNRAAHLAVGVDLDGVKHVLGIWVQANEGAKFWAGVCAELANRGVRDILIACCDGLTGLPEAIEATFPRTTVQTCVVHLIRASMRFVSYTDRKKIAAGLRPVYTAPTADAAETALLEFAESDLGVRNPAVPSLTANTSAESGANYDTYSYSPNPTTAEGTYDTSGVLKVGTFDGGGSVARSYLHFDTTGLSGSVSEAHLSVNDIYSYACTSTPPALTLSGIGATFSRSGTTWNNQPAADSSGAVSSTTFAYGYSSSCPSQTVNLDATGLAGRWAAGAANNGIVLATNETNSYGWKKFSSGAAGATTAPALSVTYATNCTFYSQTGFSVCGAIRDHYNALGGPSGFLGYPTSNELTNPDGVGKRNTFQNGGDSIYWSSSSGAFEVGGSIFTRWGQQGYEAGPLGYPTSDERAGTTSFNGTGDRQGDFQHGSIYFNHINGITNNQTNPSLLTGDKSFWSTDTTKVTDRLTAKVNRGTGNLQLSLQALTVPGVASDRTIGLNYQSLAQAPGSDYSGSGITDLHGGWRSTDSPDVRIVPGNGYADYLDNTFAVWRFTGNGPTYKAPPGFDADLTHNADNTYSLKVHSSAQKLTFDTSGMLTGDIDRNGNIVSLPAGAQPTAVTGSRSSGDGRTVHLTYGTGGRLTELCQSTTGSTCTGSATRSATTLVVDHAYSAAGNLTGVTDADGNTTTFGYDTGNSDTGMQHDLVTVTDPTGVVTRFTYDSLHRVTAVSRDDTGLQATTTYDYLAADQHTHVFDATHARSTGVFTDYGTDGTGKVTDQTDPMGHHSSTTWTADNQVKTSTNADGGTSTNNFIQPSNAPAPGQNGPESLQSTQGPTGATGSATYTNSASSNALYAPTTTTDSMKNQSTYAYDGAGNLGSKTDASAATAALTHNPDGTVATTTDPNNAAVGSTPAKSSTYTYEPGNTHNLKTVTPPGGDNTLAARQYTYDGFGRTLTSVTGKLTTTYGYDQQSRVTSQTPSDGGHAVTVQYDADGNPHVTADGTGTVTNAYTPLNLLKSATRTGTSPSTLSYTYDLGGNTTGVTDGGGTTGYHYNKAGELDQISEVGGTLTILGYNGDHKPIDTWNATSGTNGTAATYDSTGNTLLAPAAFAAHTHSTLDVGDRVTETKTTRASSDSTVAADISYCYSAYVAGQACPASGKNSTDTDKRQYSFDHVSGATTVLTYDSGSRLTSSVMTGGTAAPKTYNYCYDADGNRTYDTTSSVVDCTQVGAGKPIAATHTYNSVNQLTSDGAVFDVDGNQTAPAPLTASSYNNADQTVSLTPAGKTPLSATYAGGDQNERLALGGTTYTSGIPGLLSETTGGSTAYYERDPNGTLIARRNTNGPAYYYLDGTSSVLGLINSSGAVVASYAYDPYGNTTSVGGSNLTLANNNPYRYASGYDDIAIGLYKFGERYYQPLLGRWTQLDTLDIIGDPATGNRYAYAGDDSINNIDPNGKFSVADAIETVGVAVGLGTAAVVGIVATPEAVAIGGVIGLADGAYTGAVTIACDFSSDSTAC